MSACALAGLSPVFVMNPYHSGLGIARCLSPRGVRVYGLASEPGAPAACSRFFEKVYPLPNGRAAPEAFLDALIAIASRQPERPVLFPTSDLDVMFVHANRAALARSYRLPQEDDTPSLRLMDKVELDAVAQSLGIPTPATSVCRCAKDLEAWISRACFPVIIKPRFACQWRREDVWDKVRAKALVASCADELRSAYRQVAELAGEVLLQEYVAGHDSDLVMFCCYVDRRGQVLGHFTGRKVIQHPARVGTGAVVEATEVPAIVSPSVSLLAAFRYSGLAEIEFKYDRRREAFYLIEANPRHWDQHELGRLVGVDVSWLAYRDICGLQPRACTPTYRPGVKCRWIAEHELMQMFACNAVREMGASTHSGIRTLLTVLPKAFREARAALEGVKVFSVLMLRDPLPGTLMCLRMARQLLRLFNRRSFWRMGAIPQQSLGHTTLLSWAPGELSAFARKVVFAKHHAHQLALFGDDALIDLIENYPRERLQVFTMGTDLMNRDDWRPVDTAGASGSDIWRAIAVGRLWMKLLGVHLVDRRYRELIATLYGELSQQRRDFAPARMTGTLIVSSPTALVYYHADGLPNLLWQLRGTKRVWIYPANDRSLIGQDLMEDIFANFADEEAPYSPAYELKARAYDLHPGEVLAWPQNSPHRVTNVEGVNVSLSTFHETEDSDRRKLVYCANRLFRRRYHLPFRSTAEAGLLAYLKRQAYRSLRRVGLAETAPRRVYLTNLRTDPRSPTGYSEVPDGPVLTEFSRKEFKIERDSRGKVRVVRVDGTAEPMAIGPA